MAILQLAFCFILISFTTSMKPLKPNNQLRNSTNRPWAHHHHHHHHRNTTNRPLEQRPHRFADPVQERVERDTVGNVQFDLPDLAISWDAGNGARYQLEAFRDKRNEQLLSQEKFLELRWVSLGQPRLVKANSVKELFSFSGTGFTMGVEMLTRDQRELLKNAANIKYPQANVQENQILQLVPERFDCKLTVPDAENTGNEDWAFLGKVSDFHQTPFKLIFNDKTPKKKLFQKLIDNYKEVDIDLAIFCEIHSEAVSKQKNVLTITSEQISNMKMDEKFFGPADERVVTRDQMNKFASELFTTLNVEEDYEIKEEQFSKYALDTIISSVTGSSFQLLDFDKAMKDLSPYKMGFTADLTPDLITDMASKMFVVKKIEGKDVITKQDIRLNGDPNGLSPVDMANLQRALMDRIAMGGAVSVVNECGTSKGRWGSTNVAVSTQVDEMNKENLDDVKWALKGEKIIPKSLNVVRMSKGNFLRGFKFDRVFQTVSTSSFNRYTALYTKDFVFSPDQINAMTNDYKNFEAFVPQRSSQVQDTLTSYATEASNWLESTDAELIAFQSKADENFKSIKSQVDTLGAVVSAKVSRCQTSYRSSGSIGHTGSSNSPAFGASLTAGKFDAQVRCMA